METQELLKKVRKIEIKTRGLSSHIFSGEDHSAFKGRGMAFSEVREYTAGDDIRAIDWNVTARFGHPFVKVFEEERELTVMLLVDVSASGKFGTKFSGSTYIDKQHHCKFPFFFKNFYKRMSESRSNIPVNCSDVITCSIFTHFAESHS